MLPFLAISQELAVVRDAGFRVALGVDKRFTKDLSVDFNQELRFYHDFSKTDDCISDLGISYSVNKNISFGIGGRYTYNIKRDETVENDLRYSFDISYKSRLSQHVVIKCRLKYDKEYFGVFAKSNPDVLFETDFRYRLRMEYKLNGANSLYASGEVFRKTEKLRDPYFSKIRCFAGDEFKLKPGVFDCALGYEWQNKISYDASFFFIAVAYTFKF